MRKVKTYEWMPKPSPHLHSVLLALTLLRNDRHNEGHKNPIKSFCVFPLWVLLRISREKSIFTMSKTVLGMRNYVIVARGPRRSGEVNESECEQTTRARWLMECYQLSREWERPRWCHLTENTFGLCSWPYRPRSEIVDNTSTHILCVFVSNRSREAMLLKACTLFAGLANSADIWETQLPIFFGTVQCFP